MCPPTPSPLRSCRRLLQPFLTDLPLAERVAGMLCQTVLHAASLRCSHRGRMLLQIILGVERRAVNSIRGRVRKGSGV